MAWIADLAGKAENLLNSLDETTGAAIRSHNKKRPKCEKLDYPLHPDGNWTQKKRISTRNPKKNTSVIETKSNYTSSMKPAHARNPLYSQIKELPESKNGGKVKKCPERKSPQYHLNNCPKTMVDDVQGDTELSNHFGMTKRRTSLPIELDLVSNDEWTLRMQNLEVENAMLKNELNVMNREVSELLDRLRKSDDELSKTHFKLESTGPGIEKHRVNIDKESHVTQLDQIMKKINQINDAQKNHENEKQSLNTQIAQLQDCTRDLEERIREITKNKEIAEASHLKLETELRHAQTKVLDLEGQLEKSNAECHRLEKDWESYKVRVKNMLYSKDSEIRSLQGGLSMTKDARLLMDQIEGLKDERDELSEAISRVHDDSETMRAHLTLVEARYKTADKAVLALRDALKEERGARSRAEAQCVAFSKELKSYQLETGQTIASLRTALRDKDSALNNLRESTSDKTVDTSALNVADYDVTQDTIDNEKIHSLTQTLIQRQGKVDMLLAENNMLRIQMDKLNSKLKTEVYQRTTHSIVKLQSSERLRRVHDDSTLQVISHRMAAVIRRYPALRIFIVIYMICLHFWVMTVLLTNTPTDSYISKSARS